MSMNAVKIRGLEVYACHGVHDEEKVNPQPFIFDVDIVTDFYKGALSDDLSGTVNYSKVCDILADVAQKNVFNLIETLAYSGVYAIFELSLIHI